MRSGDGICSIGRVGVQGTNVATFAFLSSGA